MVGFCYAPAQKHLPFGCSALVALWKPKLCHIYREKFCSLDCVPPMSKHAADWISIPVVYALACRIKKAGSVPAPGSCCGAFFWTSAGSEPNLSTSAGHWNQRKHWWTTKLRPAATPLVVRHFFYCILMVTKSPSVKNYQTIGHRRSPKSRLLRRPAHCSCGSSTK